MQNCSDNSFKFDVNKYFSEIDSPSNPNSVRYFLVLLNIGVILTICSTC